MKTWNKTISPLRYDEQKLVANDYPDLREDSVLGRSIEGLVVQMLFIPFEKEFDRPAFAVQLCDGRRILDGGVVGQEVIEICRLKVIIHNEFEGVGILSKRVMDCEPDGLVGENAGAHVNILELDGLASLPWDASSQKSSIGFDGDCLRR